MEHVCVDVEHFWSGDLAPSPISASAASPALSLRQPVKMSSPPSEDPLTSFDHLAEFLPPAIDFGEGFQFDEPFNFGDSGDGLSVNATGGSMSYGTYDDDSCSFSVESSVQLRRRCRCHKQRRPNRLYRKESVKLSSWYRNFLRPGMTRDLTHELSTSDRYREFRLLF